MRMDIESPTPRAPLYAELKAHALYILVFWLLCVPAWAFLTGPLGEHIARNWLVAFSMTISPLVVQRIMHWLPTFILGIAVGLISLEMQSYFAYGIHHYQPTAPIPPAWLLGSLVFFVVATAAASWVARTFAWREFSAFG